MNTWIDGTLVRPGDRWEWGLRPDANGIYVAERRPVVKVWPRTIAQMVVVHGLAAVNRADRKRYPNAAASGETRA